MPQSSPPLCPAHDGPILQGRSLLQPSSPIGQTGCLQPQNFEVFRHRAKPPTAVCLNSCFSSFLIYFFLKGNHIDRKDKEIEDVLPLSSNALLLACAGLTETPQQIIIPASMPVALKTGLKNSGDRLQGHYSRADKPRAKPCLHLSLQAPHFFASTQQV